MLGVAAALGTIAIATLEPYRATTLLDLLAVVFAIWTLGWTAGAAYGGQPVLRAEHFALTPIPRARLAIGLLGAAFAGVATAITLLAFTATVVFAARLGAVPVLVALPGVVL